MKHTLPPELALYVDRMSDEMAVPAEALVNQAVFTWARLHGYADASLVDPLDDVPVVVLVLNDRELVVDTERFLIGRDVSCNLTIDSGRISRQHAVLTLTPRGAVIEDLKSSNGTWFLGERISQRELRDGDVVFVGDVGIRVDFRERTLV